jgi:hypothetical protein
MGLLCVTIDLDEIHCYSAIHGINEPEGDAARAVYGRALPRIAEFLKELEIRGTLFVVGRDLKTGGEAASILRELRSQGHEMGNHSMNHRYDFAALPIDQLRQEIDLGADVIEQETGQRPKGFRAPGYNVHSGITDLLKERGYLYDSSVFPCPIYYTAKAAVIGAKTIMGQRSASQIGDPRIIGAPTGPYRIGAEGVWTRGDGLTELPITVVTPARLPFIGTSLAVMGALPASMMARAAAGLQFVNLELHGIDFADADGDALGALKQYQPDLRIPLVQRRRTLRRVVRVLVDAGLEPVTLAEASSRVFV